MYKQPGVLCKLSDEFVVSLEDATQKLRELAGKPLQDQVSGIVDQIEKAVCKQISVESFE